MSGGTVLEAVPAILGLLLAAVLYVRLAWWAGKRWGNRSLLALWLGATLLAAAIAASLRGVASPDELVFASPSNAWMEAAGLAALVALPGFGLAALSVRKRRKRDPDGPKPKDWALGVGAALAGALVPAVVLALLVTIFWA
jgi:hypothetical protein